MFFENEQISSDELPQIEHLYFESIESKYTTVAFISSFLFWLIIFAGLAALYLLNDDTDKFKHVHWVLLGVALLAFAQIFVTMKSCKVKSFALREKDIIYRTGYLWYKEIAVPFNRVQHLEVVRGPIARMFNLASLKLFTAGGQQSDLKIPGLKPDKANRLKEVVSRKIRVDEEE